jgi:hypothetical protein
MPEILSLRIMEGDHFVGLRADVRMILKWLSKGILWERVEWIYVPPMSGTC